ncbi:MAG TPA: tryptophan synthase subunit alpha [Bacillales bacterium]|nr:tryptophan synthase subunit alpha [Bacillales bacterium]
MNERFRQSIENGARPLFIPFITAGDPNAEATIDLAVTLQEAGANAIELGIPYSDPLADGPVIQAASERALQAGMSLKKAMALVPAMRAKGVKVPILVFTYYNLLLQLGEDQFFELARTQDIDGLLVPDLPFEESGVLREAAAKNGLAFISLVAPTTSSDRLKRIAENAEGFLYCVSSLGVTGVRDGEFHENVYRFLGMVRRFSSIPVAVGFGISSREQVNQLEGHCDGVIVGSAIVREISRHSHALASAETRPQALLRLKTFILELNGRTIAT